MPWQVKYPKGNSSPYGKSVDFRIWNGQDIEEYVTHEICVEYLRRGCECGQGGDVPIMEGRLVMYVQQLSAILQICEFANVFF